MRTKLRLTAATALRHSELAAIALAGGLSSILAGPASAAVVNLTLDNPAAVFVQQANDHPCIYGDPSCKNPTGFGFTTLGSGGTQNFTNLASPTYTVSQIQSVLAGTTAFSVGIDVNSTKQPIGTEELQLFQMFVNGAVVAQYSAAAPGTPLADPNPGSGFSDDQLNGFDLSSFAPNATVSFNLTYNNGTGGSEEFFLIAASPPASVPEPPSLALVAGALGVLALVAYRPWKRTMRKA